jgi:hypothetical protein
MDGKCQMNSQGRADGPLALRGPAKGRLTACRPRVHVQRCVRRFAQRPWSWRLVVCVPWATDHSIVDGVWTERGR